MQILKGTITQLAGEGRLTLQVPQMAICTPGTTVDMDEAPDNWFCYLKSQGRGHVPALGKESGFLYLTRAGYEANKDALKTAFESAIARGRDRTRGIGWPAFERAAEEHFAYVQKAAAKQKKLLESKLQELQGFVA